MTAPLDRPKRLKRKQTWILPGGEVLQRVHLRSQCVGEKCLIHNPSDHHMRTWPMHWRSDRKIMERLCQCGIGHSDPDEINDPTGIHGCCGHCVPGGYTALQGREHHEG